MKQILLLDMDNVLLKPHGYRRSLQKTLQAVAAALGFQSPDFTDEVIEQIEASGVTSEWEIVAITAAILMSHLPAELHTPLPDQLALDILANDLKLPPPILPSFELIAQMDPERSPLDRALEILFTDEANFGAEQEAEIRWILSKARTMDSVIYRTIQELVLGSKDYEASYGTQGSLAVESYLKRYDQPSLSTSTADCLQAWRSHSDREAVIFTNRPSTPPAGHDDTPEAEIGAALVGLEGLPIIGSGDLGWLAKQRDERPDRYLKPSGVHALSALLMALAIEKSEALRQAWALVQRNDANRATWEPLNDLTVFVYEDSAKGFRSALNAQKALASIGVTFQVKLVGISQHPAKQAELAALQAQIFPDINQALRATLPDCDH